MEHGKPVSLPIWESNSQEKPIEVRVEEDGKSKGCSVMGQIRMALGSQDHPTRKRADFRLVFHHENA
jgi:hypothetical protein